MLLTEAEVRRLVKHVGQLEKDVEETHSGVATNPGFLGLVATRRRLLLEEQVEKDKAALVELDEQAAVLRASMAATRLALRG